MTWNYNIKNQAKIKTKFNVNKSNEVLQDSLIFLGLKKTRHICITLFQYIFFSSLHEQDMKMYNFKFYGGYK